MKLFILAALFAALCAQSESQGLLGSISKGFGSVSKGFGSIFGMVDTPKNPCERDPLSGFHDAVSDFSIRLMKRASYYSNGPFIISPYAIWLSLAAISEFADRGVQKELFTALNLPEEKCLREKYYQIAMSIESKGVDVRFERNRALAIDEKAIISKEWKTYSDQTNILRYIQVPFDAASFQNVPATMGIASQIAFDGHSIFLDRLDFESVWSTAFSEGNIERAPFYNEFGQEAATIEYMRMKTRVRLAHIPIINAKILELPVGSDGRYTMLLTMGINNNTVKKILDLLMSSIIVDIMSALTLSLIPIDVAVPRFSVESGIDARLMLEDLGLGRMFSDPDVTRYISDPPALPCGYLQKVSVNITSGNFAPRNPAPNNILSGFLNFASNTATGLASAVGRDFIANKPFIYTLVETKTQVTVFTGVYSYVDARKVQDLRKPRGANPGGSI